MKINNIQTGNLSFTKHHEPFIIKPVKWGTDVVIVRSPGRIKEIKK